MVFLIPLSIALCYALVLRAQGDGDKRAAMLLASVFVGALIVASTELLGQIGALRFWPVVLTWVIACVGLAIAAGPKSVIDSLRRGATVRLDLLEKSMLGYLLVILLVTAVLVVSAPPNTWDSMTYHMSRVMHWMQAGSVAFYPTSILRQLHSNPWAEFAIMHAQILSGGDRFANAVQWLGMVGSLVATSAVASELDTDRRGQLFTAVVCASIPMGILQATSTQTDYTVGFWLVCFVYFGLRIVKGGSPIYFIGMGLAGGLAILTKATAYVFAFPFALLIGAALLVKMDRSMWKWIATACCLAVVLNVGHAARNFAFYGKPLGPGAEEGGFVYTNEVLSTPAILSNIVRNASLHLHSPPPLSTGIQEAITILHARVLGIDVSDRRTTWSGVTFQVYDVSLNEDVAGNPLHFFLIVLACIAYPLVGKKRTSLATGYLLALIVAFVLFCGYLKFQPWHSRLHLTLFVLWTPFLGWLTRRMAGGHATGPIAIALMLGSLPALLLSPQKPLLAHANVFTVPRDQQYFSKRPELFDQYMQASRVLRQLNCPSVGLALDGDDWEYPFWKLTNSRTQKIGFEHVQVRNASAKLHSDDAERPCAIVRTFANSPTDFTMDGSMYRQVWRSEAITIYASPQPGAPGKL